MPEPIVKNVPLEPEDKRQIMYGANLGSVIMAASAGVLVLVSFVLGSWQVPLAPAIIQGVAGLVVVIALVLQLASRASLRGTKMVIKGALTQRYYKDRTGKIAWFEFTPDKKQIILHTIRRGLHYTIKRGPSITYQPGLLFQFGESLRVPVNVHDFMAFEDGDLLEVHYTPVPRRIYLVKKIASLSS